MNKTLIFAKNFANFCKNYSLHPNQLADLIVITEKYTSLVVRECNGEDIKRKLDKTRQKLEKLADRLNFTVVFDSIYPSFERSGTLVYLPKES